MAHLRALAALALALSPAACGDAGGEIGGTDTSATTSDSDGETTGEPFVPIPARDVVIVRVEANPGVAVPIAVGGVAVPGPERNAFIPAGRDTLIRLFLDVGEGFVARELEARLTLVFPDGREEQRSDVRLIEEDTREGVLASGPYFGVFAPEVVSGLRFRVSLWEAAPGQEDAPEPDPPPAVPLDGSLFVGVEDSYQKLRVVVVPVAYDRDGCAATPAAEEWKQQLEDGLFQQNGVDEVELVWHEPFPVPYDMSTFSGLNSLVNDMSQLRAAEAADPWVYYYALFDSCGQCIGSGGGPLGGCTVGLAAGIPGDDKGSAPARVSAGQVFGDTVNTFVHEVGHTQGRRHIYCPNGGASGVDNSYPYEGGSIGVWGFGVRDFLLRHPNATLDYMSYCAPTWASDWQWNATYRRIATLSAWELEDRPDEPGPGLLVGALEPDGQASFWTSPGVFDAATTSSVDRVRYELGDRVVEREALVLARDHGETRTLIAPLPEGFAPDTHILHLHGQQARAVVVPAARRFHRRARATPWAPGPVQR